MWMTATASGSVSEVDCHQWSYIKITADSDAASIEAINTFRLPFQVFSDLTGLTFPVYGTETSIQQVVSQPS